jgi:hypothetical protein
MPPDVLAWLPCQIARHAAYNKLQGIIVLNVNEFTVFLLS